jgi:hypothetical protein
MAVLTNLYQEYPCSRNAPLNCDLLWQTAQEIKGAKFCLECGFPATLPLPSEIKGTRGSYQITSFVGSRGMGRLYSGKQQQNGKSVIIKEYLLPNRCFNPEETLKIKETFKRVAAMDLADSKSQNFRLVNGWEAIADEIGERCYLVLQSTPADRTLRQYLRENRAMSAAQVREVLNQILQTLEFLHTQKLLLSPHQVQQGLAHGNLSLDSIEIEVKSDREFYLYLCDLALCENLFIPPKITQPTQPDLRQDLISLGLVATSLWAGQTTNPNTGQPVHPKDDDRWSQSDPHLRQFIRHLVGLETPFENAEIARIALLKLPKPELNNSLNRLDITDPLGQSSYRQAQGRGTKWIVPGLLALCLLGVGIWYLLRLSSNPEQPTKEFILWNHLLPGFADVSGIPEGKFTYTGEQNGSWSVALKGQQESDLFLQDLLKHPRSDLEATFLYEPIASPNLEHGSQPLQSVIGGKKHFAITSFTTGITDELDRKQIANDGLLVYVAFSKQAANLPRSLNGKISLEQLRQIYTGKLTNWQQLHGPNLPIKPYAPTEVEALHQFKKIVLKDDPQDIDLFTAIATRKPTEFTQNIILKEFDRGRTGIISFGILSRTWRQCSGYPLAIVNGSKDPVQALFKDRKPINPLLVDLCDEKQENYFDVSTFHNQTNSYALSYPIFVVYPKDTTRRLAGAKFADLLLTRQGQCLLSKIGLVPLQPIPTKYLKSKCL